MFRNKNTFQLKLPLSIRWSVVIMCSPQYRSPQCDRGSPRSMKDEIGRLVFVGTFETFTLIPDNYYDNEVTRCCRLLGLGKIVM